MTPYKSVIILHPLCPVWVQSGIFICPIIVLNLNISFDFCVRLGFIVFLVCKMYEDKKIGN